MSAIAQRLRQTREEQRLTQDSVATEAGLSVQTVRRAEQTGILKLESLHAICKVLKIDPMELSRSSVPDLRLHLPLQKPFPVVASVSVFLGTGLLSFIIICAVIVASLHLQDVEAVMQQVSQTPFLPWILHRCTSYIANAPILFSVVFLATSITAAFLYDRAQRRQYGQHHARLHEIFTLCKEMQDSLAHRPALSDQERPRVLQGLASYLETATNAPPDLTATVKLLQKDLETGLSGRKGLQDYLHVIAAIAQQQTVYSPELAEDIGRQIEVLKKRFSIF